MLQTGQENIPHYGQVGKGEGFILTLYDIAYKYLGLYPRDTNNTGHVWELDMHIKCSLNLHVLKIYCSRYFGNGTWMLSLMMRKV